MSQSWETHAQQRRYLDPALGRDGGAQMSVIHSSDSRDRITAVVAYASNTSVTGYGQINGFEFVFEVRVVRTP